MKIVAEFREFALKGNVMDLAVGVIIGAAFGAIVKSLVDDLIMPLVGLLLGGVDFSDRYYVLKGSVPSGTSLEEARKVAGASLLAYGHFLNNVLTFLIVAVAVFLIVKAMNRLRRKGPAPSPTTRACPECTSPIPLAARRCPQCTAAVARP